MSVKSAQAFEEGQWSTRGASEQFPDGVGSTSTPRGGRHGARNNNKTKLFVRWLQQTFPDAFHHADDTEAEETNINHSHILDVAGGGKGELATRLAWCCQQRVVIVDPRPTNVVQCLHKHVLPQLPKKWQSRALWHAQQQEERGVSPFGQLDEMVEQYQLYFTHQNTLPGNENETNVNLVAAIEKSSLLVGMHADSATEAIVDAALHYQKPFVVVPCCVFPNLFPHRTIPMHNLAVTVDETEDNNPPATPLAQVQVRSYEDFCQYLLLKDDRFNCSVLPFPGRNLAIWWDGGN